MLKAFGSFFNEPTQSIIAQHEKSIHEKFNTSNIYGCFMGA